MQKIRDWLKGRKAYLTAGAAVLTVAVTWATGEIEWATALGIIFAALQSAFIRAGIAKAEQ